jgi:hypothetical protein
LRLLSRRALAAYSSNTIVAGLEVARRRDVDDGEERLGRLPRSVDDLNHQAGRLLPRMDVLRQIRKLLEDLARFYRSVAILVLSRKLFEPVEYARSAARPNQAQRD